MPRLTLLTTCCLPLFPYRVGRGGHLVAWADGFIGHWYSGRGRRATAWRTRRGRAAAWLPFSAFLALVYISPRGYVAAFVPHAACRVQPPTALATGSAHATAYPPLRAFTLPCTLAYYCLGPPTCLYILLYLALLSQRYSARLPLYLVRPRTRV